MHSLKEKLPLHARYTIGLFLGIYTCALKFSTSRSKFVKKPKTNDVISWNLNEKLLLFFKHTGIDIL